MPNEAARDDELFPLLEYFAERLNLVFSHFFCTLEFEQDEDLCGDVAKNARTWSLKTIQNACLHTTLIALRDLDDFLTPRTPHTKPDDLKASDFGLSQRLAFLTATERTAINKHIAHTTIPGARTQNLGWDVFELTTKAVIQSNSFLKWVEDDFGLKHFMIYTAALGCRTRTQQIYDCIAKSWEDRRQKHQL